MMKRISASPLFTQHFNRQEVNLLRWGCRRFVRGTTFGATTSKPALLANQRAQALPRGVAEAKGDDSENQKMLEPEGHIVD